MAYEEFGGDPCHHGVPRLAAAIVFDGRIVAEAATGFCKQGSDVRVQITDAFQLGSITKPMTATLAAICVEKGMLGWNLPLEDAFPELRGEMHSAYRKVTITQLLCHLGGTPYVPRTEPRDMFASLPNAVDRRYAYVKGTVEGRTGSAPRNEIHLQRRRCSGGDRGVSGGVVHCLDVSQALRAELVSRSPTGPGGQSRG